VLQVRCWRTGTSSAPGRWQRRSPSLSAARCWLRRCLSPKPCWHR